MPLFPFPQETVQQQGAAVKVRGGPLECHGDEPGSLFHLLQPRTLRRRPEASHWVKGEKAGATWVLLLCGDQRGQPGPMTLRAGPLGTPHPHPGEP